MRDRPGVGSEIEAVHRAAALVVCTDTRSSQLGVSEIFRFLLVGELNSIARRVDGHDVAQHQPGARRRPLLGAGDREESLTQALLQVLGGTTRRSRTESKGYGGVTASTRVRRPSSGRCRQKKA